MSLDSLINLDIPKSFESKDIYKASLGHKINHHFQPNVNITPIFHPRFGDILGIISIKPITKNEELFLNYEYDLRNEWTPKWYIDYWKSLPFKEKYCQEILISQTKYFFVNLLKGDFLQRTS